jgi:hypothetical protein
MPGPHKLPDPRQPTVFPAQPDPVLAESDPSAALVWIEFMTISSDANSTTGRVATYMNGTVVTEDTLIVTVLERGRKESEIVNGLNSAKLFTFKGRSPISAQPVAYDPESGLALLLPDRSAAAYLSINVSPPALNQRLRGFARTDDTSSMSSPQVTRVPTDKSEDPKEYLVSTGGNGNNLRGSPLVNSVGEIQALLSWERGVEERKGQFGETSFSRETRQSHVVPGFVINRLIEQFRARRAPALDPAPASTLKLELIQPPPVTAQPKEGPANGNGDPFTASAKAPPGSNQSGAEEKPKAPITPPPTEATKPSSK